jgi:hypothetical protein
MNCCHHIHSLLHGLIHRQFLSSQSKSVVTFTYRSAAVRLCYVLCCRLVVLCSVVDGQTFLQPQLVLYTKGGL